MRDFILEGFKLIPLNNACNFARFSKVVDLPSLAGRNASSATFKVWGNDRRLMEPRRSHSHDWITYPQENGMLGDTVGIKALGETKDQDELQ